ncbi:MAG: nucleoside deaminase [Clostridia bacterium]|nr:nucleoside deaminase [Clostridia bacterium]
MLRFANQQERYEFFMKIAIEQAKIAASIGEVPVGAVIVKDNDIIATAFNRRETGKNALYHAETDVIDKACQILGGWRLWQCELFVTLEPCPMCTGAIINARIPKVIFGAYDFKAGSCGSIVNLFEFPYNHKAELVGGILESECAALLSDFFKDLRLKRKKQ